MNNNIIDFQAQVKAAQAMILHFEQLPENSVVAFSGGSELAKSEAENIMNQPVVKKRICVALQSIAHDLDEITKESTKALWAVALTGVFIPQNPLLYGWIGILIYRAAVTGFCAEFRNNN
jgi:hypothetical protein